MIKWRKIIKPLFFVSLLILCKTNIATNSELNADFRHISFSDGLPNAFINDIAQDSLGFIWVGTNAGLFRYDGYTFRAFWDESDSPYTLKGNYISQITPQPGNKLWIATLGDGIFCFDYKREKFIDLNLPDEVKTMNISKFYIESDSSIWMGTHNGLAQLLLKHEKTALKYYPLQEEKKITSGNPVRGLNHDPSESIHYLNYLQVGNREYLWLGINEILYVFNLNDKNFQEIDSADFSSFRAVVPLKDGNFLTAFWNGGFKIYDPDFQVVHDHPFLLNTGNVDKDIRINELLFDQNDLVVLTENKGVFIFENPFGNPEIENYSVETTGGIFRSDAVACFMRDHSGVLWFGHKQGGGLSQLIEKKRQVLSEMNITTENEKLYSRDIATKDQRYLLVATLDRGLIIYDLKTRKSIVGSTNPDDDFLTRSDSYNSILYDRKGNLWLGTKGYGVEFFSKADLNQIIQGQSNHLVKSVLVNNNNYPGFMNDYVMSLYEDSKGRVWVGTWRGLYVFPANFIREMENPAFDQSISVDDLINFTHEPDLRESVILSVTEGKNGSIYIGTRHRGLLKLYNDENNYVQTLVKIHFEGYPSFKSVYSLHISGDSLYIAANTGVMRIDLSNNRVTDFYSVEKFDYMEPVGIIKHKNKIVVTGSYGVKTFENDFSGVQNFLIPNFQRKNQYYYNNLIAVKDTLYAGTYNGVSRIFFSKTVEQPTQYPLRIASLSVNDEIVTPGEKVNGRIILHDNINNTESIKIRSEAENIISFDLALMDFENPGMNQYMYKLEGVHQDYIMLSSQQRNITFSNLKPSNYVLKIKAYGPDAVPAENIIEMTMRVLPPWYQSKAAFAVYFVIVASVFWVISRFYILRERQKSALQIERSERKKTEELYNYKLEFFTNISHELRTPMALISAPLEQLIKKEDEQEKKEDLMLIYQNTNRLMFLLDQILNLRKIDNNKLKIKKQKGDIVAFGRKIFDMYKKHADMKKIDYQFKARSSTDMFAFDAFYIETIMFNLLSNAFKFVHEGGKIWVEVQRDKNDPHKLEITVEDNGIGIPSEDARHVFDRFYTSGKQDKHKKGNGIGLALTREITELHGGSITLRSYPGQGSLFKVTLHDDPSVEETNERHPVLDPQTHTMVKFELTNIQNQKNDVAPQMPVRSDGKRYKLLVIDDNTELLKFLNKSLSDVFHVTTVSSAERALQKLEKQLPDLIISDIMMPGISGLELVRLVKGNPKYHHIPVILLSARAREKQSQEGYSIGADAYITKPFSLAFLITRIGQILKSRDQLREFYKSNVFMSPSKINIKPEEKKLMDKMVEVIEQNMENETFGVEEFARELNMSRAKLYRVVAKLTNKSVKEIIRDIRLQRADQLLRTKAFSVNEVSFKVGFISVSYFIKCFREKYNKTPKELMDELTQKQSSDEHLIEKQI